MASDDKIALHQSTLSLLSKCGMMAKFYVVDGIKQPPTLPAVVGTAVHDATHANLAHKREFAITMDSDDLWELAGERFDATCDGEAPKLADDEKDDPKAARHEARELARRLAVLHSVKIAGDIDPVELEVQLRCSVAGFDYDLQGTIDVVAEDVLDPNDIAKPGVVVTMLRDTKTSRSQMTKEDVRDSVQLAMYTLLWKAHTGQHVRRVALDVLQKTKNGAAYSLEDDATLNFQPLLLRIEAAAKVLDTGAFMPVDPSGPSGWVCQPRFCGYYDRCPFGRRARTAHYVPDFETGEATT